MNHDDADAYHIEHDWHAHRAAIQSGARSVRALVQQCLDDIDLHNPRLNAYVSVATERALLSADAADQRYANREPLSAIDGLPIAVKDNIARVGMPNAAGIDARRSVIAETDATVVQRLQEAGAIILGHTNLHEAALGATTDNPWFGRTHHPLQHGVTPGGSSGGSACAVAAGMAVAALGTDTMGSVRLPASYCGLAGLKPTAGLISIAGVVPLAAELDTVGPMAHSIDDLRVITGVLAGVDERCVVSKSAPRTLNFSTSSSVDVCELSIWAPDNLDKAGAQPGVLARYSQAVETLAKVGVTFDREPLPFDLTRLRYAGLLIVEHEAAHFHAAVRERNPDGFSKELSSMLDYGLSLSDEKLQGARDTVNEVREFMQRTTHTFDVVMLPTTPHVAFSFDNAVPASQADFTGFVNLSGCPAVTFPCGLADALPVGLQLITRSFYDDTLLDMAEAIQTHTDPSRG